jgi:hypothetical protein
MAKVGQSRFEIVPRNVESNDISAGATGFLA